MKNTVRSLEACLNRIIDEELKKDTADINCETVMQCCDGLLRMDNINRYIITEKDVKDNISRIFNSSSNKNKFKKSVKTLLIAAVITVILALSAFAYVQIKYHIIDFSDHSTLSFGISYTDEVDGITPSYIPDGFTLTETNDKKSLKYRVYSNGNLFFNILKEPIRFENDINTEYGEAKSIKKNGTEYFIFSDRDHGYGIIWTNDKYKYCLSGNLSENELLKIAQAVV